MKQLLSIWFILSFLEVVRHWYIINILRRSPNKALSFIARAVVAGVFVWLDERPVWATVPTYLIVDWVLHDYLLNALRGVRPIWYLNNTGVIDRFQRDNLNPFSWFFFKMILFIGLVGAYYFNF